MAKSIFERFSTGYVIKFSVELPDDEEVILEFRMPTAAEIWQMEREMRPYPQPDPGAQPVDIKPHPDRPGKYMHVYGPADPALIEARNEWNDELQSRRILACWTEEIPGATVDEQLAALRTLPFYLVEALKECTRRVIRVSGDNIRDYPFHDQRPDRDVAVGSQAVE